MSEYQLFTLTSDVTNPNPDRRVTNDWRKLPVIRSGTVIIIQTDEDGDKRISPVKVRWTFQRVGPNSDLGKAILGASKPIDLKSLNFDERVGLIRVVHGLEVMVLLKMLCEENPMLLEALVPGADRFR